MSQQAMTPEQFEHALRGKGDYYHIHHPYHVAMHTGQATREQIQGCVANRFYYQISIPMKDAAIWLTALIERFGGSGFSAF